ncbi:hypothetical protein [Oceanobacillus senegalensis]|uniref:hypothetical protein n=1 Tax=Oceanobacillus senegalensis TaxID=1936063 RepID=UPI000A313F43|nr:hypothetical protein [Oceanobacillus senegalensis]
MKKQKHPFIVIALLTSFLLLMMGCTENTESENQDENRRTIETVLQKNLNGPDEELEQIWNDMEGEEGIIAFGQYEENRYKNYFANDTSYQEYVSSYGSVLWIEPMRNNYKLKVNEIQLEQTDSEQIIYNFTVEVAYRKEGSKHSEVGRIKGQANLNEEHKIEDMLIHTNLWETFSK